MFPETIEEYVSESGIDLKTLFDPVNRILYLERADGTYESKELEPKNRAAFTSTLMSITDYVANGFWPGEVPKLQSGTASATESGQVGASDFVLYGAGYDDSGKAVFEAGFKVDINYAVVVTAQYDSTSGNWKRSITAVAVKDAVNDASSDIQSKYGAAPSNWSDLSSFEEWMDTLNVKLRGKGLVDVQLGVSASNVGVSRTDGDLKIDTNGNLYLTGNAPVI